MPETKTCVICQQPLGEFELNLNVRYHHTCNKCSICGEGQLDLDMLNNQIDKGLTIGHSGCVDQKLSADIKNELEIRMEHIDYINKVICSKWKVEPSVSEYDSLRKHLIALQEAAANVSMLMGATKDRLAVRDAIDYRNKTKEQREAEKLAERSKAEKQIKTTEHLAQLEAEKKDPTLKLRRRQIESFITLGMSAADAENAVREIESKRRVN